MASTQVSQIVKAPRAAVYRACLDPEMIVRWRVPDIMTGKIHSFDAREGGGYRMSLTYRDDDHPVGGKTSAHTDSFHGRFLELIPDTKIVETVRFETNAPDLRAPMTLTTSFREVDGGTEVTILCENLPPGVRAEDNKLGTRQSLKKLAALFA
jgi:uncharacterized protein YndB with AHSA1/START domain